MHKESHKRFKLRSGGQRQEENLYVGSLGGHDNDHGPCHTPLSEWTLDSFKCNAAVRVSGKSDASYLKWKSHVGKYKHFRY